MISDSLPARSAIQLFALIQTSVAPLSFIYYLHYTVYRESLFHLWFPSLFPSPTSAAATNTFVFLHYWLGFELVFYVYFQITRSRLQRIVATPTTEAERSDIFQNSLATIEDVRIWLVGWFFVNGRNNSRPKFEDVRKENVAEWFAWAFWNSTLETVLEDPRHTRELYAMLTTVEKHYGVTFPPGYDEDVCCIRLSLDPVNAIHRPFAFYAIILTGTQLANALLRWRGLERYGSEFKGYYWSNTFEMDIKEVWGNAIPRPHVKGEPERIVYWHYKSQQRSSTPVPQKRTPVVFIHGIGVGILSYIEWVLRLLSLDREIFFVELPYVSMQLVEDVPTMQETVREIEQMLENHGHKQAIFVGHSLGSAVLSWVFKNTPKMVAAMIMIDPICFLLHYPDIAYNFVYRIPKRANEHIINFFASRELYISYYISRHFNWSQAAIFLSPSSTTPPIPPTSITSVHTLPNRTVVFLSEHDNLVNSPRVATYLHSRDVDAHIMPGLDHASFLFSEEWKARILSSIRTYGEDIDAEGERPAAAPVAKSVSTKARGANGKGDVILTRVASVVAKVGRKATRASGGGRKGKKTV